MNRVLIALPAYNEANFVKSVLFEILKYASQQDILVIDDGSDDDTGKVAASYGVNVLTHEVNCGKGAALISAFDYAKTAGYKWVICMDSDGQHSADNLTDFFQQIKSTDATIILGNRSDRSKEMPIHRILSNGITSILISLLSGRQRIHDSQCGYRAVRLSRIETASMREKGFQLESELLIHVGRSGGKIVEIPITTVYGQQGSSIRLVRDTIKFMRLILFYLWR